MDGIEAWLAQGGAALERGDFVGALEPFERVLAKEPANIYAGYGKAFCIARIGPTHFPPEAQAELRGELCAVAERVIRATDVGLIAPFTDSGAARRAMLRFLHHCLAWHGLHHETSATALKKALRHARKGLDLGDADIDLLADQVGLLRKLGRDAEAFEVVHGHLSRGGAPSVFDGVAASPAYRDWLDRRESGAAGPPGETAIDALRRLDRHLRETEHPAWEGVDYAPPASAEDVARFEKRHGLRLPPGYVALVSGPGAPSLRRREDADEDRGSWELLGPAEIAEASQAARSWHLPRAGAYDPADLFLFQRIGAEEDPDGYVFDRSQPRKGGEWGIGPLHHDAPYEGAPWDSFDEHIRAWVDRLIRDEEEA